METFILDYVNYKKASMGLQILDDLLGLELGMTTVQVVTLVVLEKQCLPV